MRRSTRFVPFSKLALWGALGALGVIAFVSPARAADVATPSGAQATPAPEKSAAGLAKATPAADKTGQKKPAPDKKTRDAARKAYGDAEKAYAAGDFAAAYTGYAKANELIPSAHAAYWAAKSLDQGGKTGEALQGYEALLADPGSSKIGEDKVGDAQTRLATLKAGLVGEVTVTSPAASAVLLLVDGASQPSPLPVVLKLAPGPHKLNISAPGFDAKEVDLKVEAGTKVEQAVVLQEHVVLAPPPAPVPEVVPPPPPPPPPEKHSKAPAYVTLGIAAGGAIVGTIFGVQALQAKNDFNKAPSTKHADDTERNALIADMAFGVAITLGVTGIVLLTSSDEAGEAPARAAKLHLPPKSSFHVVPYVGRESGGAAARLTF